MPIVTTTGSLEGASNLIRMKNSSGTSILEVGQNGSNVGYYLASGRPGFVAGSATDPSWVNYATNAWAKVNNYCAATSYNRGNHYNTSTTRFNVPFTGPYLFVFSSYIYSSDYAHPVFAVNASVSARRYNVPYRMRGHGKGSNYQMDAQIEEVIYCTAGDYVEAYMYAGGTGYHYAYYSLFQGVYVG